MNDTLPRLANGQFLSRACPDCGEGTLQPDRDGDWACDGLADPDDVDKDLVCCERQIIDGVIYPHPAKS